MAPLRESTKIVLFIIGAMIVFWTLLYQVTIRSCLEYFTYPPVFVTQAPTALAASWGALIGFGFGLLVGISITTAAPTLSLSRLLIPIGLLVAAMTVAAALGGIISYLATSLGFGSLSTFDAERVPESLHRSFIVVRWAHLFAGLAGLGATAAFVGWIVFGRVWEQQRQSRDEEGAKRSGKSKRTPSRGGAGRGAGK